MRVAGVVAVALVGGPVDSLACLAAVVNGLAALAVRERRAVRLGGLAAGCARADWVTVSTVPMGFSGSLPRGAAARLLSGKSTYVVLLANWVLMAGTPSEAAESTLPRCVSAILSRIVISIGLESLTCRRTLSFFSGFAVIDTLRTAERAGIVAEWDCKH